jgi:hypothetical protein
VEHLQTRFDDPDVITAYIYCDYGQRTTQTTPILVASLLKQIVQDCRQVSENVKAFYHRRKKARPPHFELSKVLKTEIGMYTKAFVVVDALDEFATENEFRAKFLEELRSLPDNVKLMVTSRNITSIEQLFHGASRLDIRASDEDLRRCVDDRLQAYGSLKHLNAIIVSKVVEKAAGM